MDNEYLSFEDWLTQSNLPEGKRRVLQAAVKLFAKQGFHATSTSAIAKEAGLSDGAMFKHFKNKEALLDAITSPLIEQLAPEFSKRFIDDVQNQSNNLDNMIRFMIKDRWDFLNRNNEVIQIIMGELLSNNEFRKSFVSSLSARFSDLVRILRGLIKSDNTINSNLDAYDVIRLIGGQLSAHFVSKFKFGVVSDDKAVVEKITLMTQHAIHS
jgi:AcrR family transcriptional regulator